MKVSLLITLIIFMFASVVTAQDPPKPLLKSGDVKHFIKTFPLLAKEMENHGFEYEARDGSMTVPEAVNTRNEFLEILKKHGWDENFFQKTGVILLGYSSVVYGEEIKEADSSMDESLKEIDSNQFLSDEMKKQLKEQMKTAKNAMKQQETTFKESIHPDDLKLIKPHIEEIRKVIDEDHNGKSRRKSSRTIREAMPGYERASSDLALEINALLKTELEKEFGPLSSENFYEKREIFGRVISCDYLLQEGNLDNSWVNGVVTAMDQIGITAIIDGNEVIAENQGIANTKFIRLQFTTSRGIDDFDSIAATFLFPNK